MLIQALLVLIFRQIKQIPYTVLLLLGGYVFDIIIQKMVEVELFKQEPEFYQLIAKLDPHVILFVFLPALIFESAFYTNMHVFLKQFSSKNVFEVSNFRSLLTFAKFISAKTYNFFT